MSVKKLFVIIVFSSSLLAGTAGATTPWYAPLVHLPNQATIKCVLRAESRSTYAQPNTRDVNPQQYGPFQFTPILWNRWAWEAGVGHKEPGYFTGTTALNAVSIPAHQASLLQQAEVFATVARNDGLWPWTRFDGCG